MAPMTVAREMFHDAAEPELRTMKKEITS